jgi:hypothetical protein
MADIEGPPKPKGKFQNPENLSWGSKMGDGECNVQIICVNKGYQIEIQLLTGEFL